MNQSCSHLNSIARSKSVDEIESVLILDTRDLIRSHDIESHDHYYHSVVKQRAPNARVESRGRNCSRGCDACRARKEIEIEIRMYEASDYVRTFESRLRHSA